LAKWTAGEFAFEQEVGNDHSTSARKLWPAIQRIMSGNSGPGAGVFRRCSPHYLLIVGKWTVRYQGTAKRQVD